MDKYNSKTALEDDQSDSWSIVDENLPEDGLDFEIVKDLFENRTDDESVSSEIDELADENIIPTIVTFPNDNNEEKEDTKLTNTPNNEKEDSVVINVKKSEPDVKKSKPNVKKSSSHSLRFRFHSDTDTDTDLEKNASKPRKKRRRNIHKCPFVTGVSLGTILTVYGLSLILKSSQENVTCPEDKNVTCNLNSSLGEALDEHTGWPTLLEEEKLLRKHCPRFTRDLAKHKNFQTKMLKRLDRKVKQQVRGFDTKALKTTKQDKLVYHGPLNKDEAIKKHEENIKVTTSQNVEEKSFIDNFTFKPVLPVPKLGNINRTEPIKENKPITSENNLTKALSELEEAYTKYRQNIIQNKTSNNEQNKTDVQTTLENKINNLREENDRISKIITQHESLMTVIEAKHKHMKQIYEKRNQLQNNLEKHLELVKKRKNTSQQSTSQALSKKLSDQLLDEMLMVTVKNNKTNAVRPEEEYILGNKSEQKCSDYGTIEKENEYERNVSIIKPKPAAKKPKESLEIFLERQKLIAAKARKMEDKEHTKQSNHCEKCDPKKSWIRKRNEFY